MTKKDVTIQNEKGLHARPATLFIQKANTFKSSVWVEHGTRKANAKSHLGVLSLAVSKGDVITLSAEGADEAEAVVGLSQLISELED